MGSMTLFTHFYFITVFSVFSFQQNNLYLNVPLSQCQVIIKGKFGMH